MKFRQRQILLSVVLFCFAVVVFLHSRTPDNTEQQLLEAHRRDAARTSRHPKPDPWPRTGSKDDDDDPSPRNRSWPRVVADGGAEVGDEAGVGRQTEKDVGAVAERGPVPPVYVNQTSGTGSDCPRLLRPDRVQEAQVFQKVDGQATLLEFSAFLDVEQRLVRVVGLSVSRKAYSVLCLLWYRPGARPDGKELRVVPGSLVVLPEHHSRKYSAHFVECHLPEADVYPYAVSVTSQDCRQATGTGDVTAPATNVMPVLRVPEALQRNFTVCVTALNYRYSRAYELVEMIELNRLLGAELFTFYLHSVGENVLKVLRWYQQRGLVQLVDWKLPMAVDHWPPAEKQPEVHYFAQLASHNDCLNRHRGVSRYLVYQDLDEFIIPKRTTTWAEFLRTYPGSYSGYQFRCVFFRKDWPPNGDNYTGRATADKFRSVVLSTDKREPTYFPFGNRAKYMVDPRAVQAVGIHNVWKFRGPSRLANVPEGEAALHHYRNWENPKDAGRAVRDTDLYRFKDRLLHELEERWSQLPQVPLDIPLSQYGQV